MRGVGHKRPLLAPGLAQPGQQGVQGADQRRHLVGQISRRQRLQGGRVLLCHLARHPGQRPQRPGDQPPQRGGHRGRGQQQRQHAAQRGIGCQALADAHRLGHLDHLVARGHCKTAPALTVHPNLGQPQHRLRRQRPVRPRGIDAAAVDAPDLHHKVEAFVVQRGGITRGDLALVAQAQRHLAQLVIKQRLGLVQHIAVGDAAHQRGGQRQCGQQ